MSATVPVTPPPPPAPPVTAREQRRFECTCGFKLEIVEDLDRDTPFVTCSHCGGIAVRRTTKATP